MQVIETAFDEVKLFAPIRRRDARGLFCEIYREDILLQSGIGFRVVQENHAFSGSRGVVRGLHFQIPPLAQAKLLRVSSGSILDVVVDIRWGSPTYGHHLATVLSARDWNQIYVPEGFAHGYCSLEPDSEVVYKVNRFYSVDHERGLLWNDPALGIPWPVTEAEAILSEKDQKNPRLADLPRFFLHEAPRVRAPKP